MSTTDTAIKTPIASEDNFKLRKSASGITYQINPSTPQESKELVSLAVNQYGYLLESGDSDFDHFADIIEANCCNPQVKAITNCLRDLL